MEPVAAEPAAARAVAEPAVARAVAAPRPLPLPLHHRRPRPRFWASHLTANLQFSLSAGGVGTLNLTVANSGGTASSPGALTATAPSGVTLTQPVPAGLRTRADAFVTTTNTTGWQLPVVAPGGQTALTFTVVADPTAVSGTITFALNGKPIGSVPYTVASGYASLSLGSAVLIPGVPAVLTLQGSAVAKVSDPGPVTIPASAWPAGIKPVSATPLAESAPPCTVATSGAVSCPAAAVAGGVRIRVTVSADTVPGEAIDVAAR